MLTGRRPDGDTAPVSTSASACPPSWPGKNACTTAAASSASGADRVRPPGQQHQDDRGARVQQRPDQVGLDARQVQVGGVAALARRAAAEQPGPVADRDDAHVGVRAAATAASNPVRSGSVTSQPRA